MSDLPDTRASLLVRVRDPRDATAWGEFARVYAGLIARFIRKRGLQPADTDDLTQAVLADVSVGVRGLEYDPARGTFRGWLFTIVRRHLGRFRERAGRVVAGSGDTGVKELLEAVPQADEQEWDAEYRLHLFRRAAEAVRVEFTPANWEAFWQTAVLGRRPADVGAEVGLSVGAVYTAKCRILERIRVCVRHLDGEPEAA